jgi:vancomycin permeability regulator SanA
MSKFAQVPRSLIQVEWPGVWYLWWISLKIGGMAFFRPIERAVRAAGRIVVWVAAAVALVNTLNLLLAPGGASLPWFPPVSLVLTLMLALVALAGPVPGTPFSAGRTTFAAVLAAALFPILQVLALGWTDYRRPASAAVVFGARAYAAGRPSEALADRVRTACELHRLGLVRTLVFSGGPGDGPVHETESMRRMAMELGVPSESIRLDPEGLSTRETARNTACLFPPGERVLAVSEFYHLPRIRIAFAQEGLEVLTVPARPGNWLRRLPLRSMAREIAAYWVYFFRAAIPTHSRIPC